jgi:hypothetical protein
MVATLPALGERAAAVVADPQPPVGAFRRRHRRQAQSRSLWRRLEQTIVSMQYCGVTASGMSGSDFSICTQPIWRRLPGVRNLGASLLIHFGDRQGAVGTAFRRP